MYVPCAVYFCYFSRFFVDFVVKSLGNGLTRWIKTMAVRIRDELVGKRFLAVKGRSTVLPGSNDRPTDWAGLPGSCNWNSGVVRAATGKVLSDESFQVRNVERFERGGLHG